jgi:hypothetical protein
MDRLAQLHPKQLVKLSVKLCQRHPQSTTSGGVTSRRQQRLLRETTRPVGRVCAVGVQEDVMKQSGWLDSLSPTLKPTRRGFFILKAHRIPASLQVCMQPREINLQEYTMHSVTGENSFFSLSFHNTISSLVYYDQARLF